MECSAYQNLIARIEKKELECFGSVCDGDIPERCTNLEKYYKIYAHYFEVTEWNFSRHNEIQWLVIHLQPMVAPLKLI